ncbi:hypothetical protein BC332_32626 [Capsicum chinense]|nr:hypothetical protein BC332_32626 [Capsicum chinense]
MLEIEQPNEEEMHVFVKDNILRFFIYEFALITGLNCFGNVEDFKYDDSYLNRLTRRYFPQSMNEVDKEALVERFLNGNFETIEDALQMAILYFIHTFIYSQLNASSVSFSDFKMIEDEKVVVVWPQYNQFMIEMFSKELEKLDLPPTSFASDHPGTSSMPSSTENPD